MSAELSLKNLVEAAVDGDQNALNALRQRYRPSLKAFIDANLPESLRANNGVGQVLWDVDDCLPKELDGFQWQNKDAFDAWLISVVKRQVLGRLLKKFECRTVNIICRSLPDRLRRDEVAEDIWQETCRVAVKKWDSFLWRGENAFLGWLLTIAKRQIWDTVKQNPRGVVNIHFLNKDDSSRPGLIEQICVDNHTPGKPVRQRERAKKLRAKMREVLTEREQRVLELRYFQLKSIRETAELMKISESNVTTISNRAMKKLRCALRDPSVFVSSD